MMEMFYFIFPWYYIFYHFNFYILISFTLLAKYNILLWNNNSWWTWRYLICMKKKVFNSVRLISFVISLLIINTYIFLSSNKSRSTSLTFTELKYPLFYSILSCPCLLERKVISLCHQYWVRPACTSVLYCWLANFKFLSWYP